MQRYVGPSDEDLDDELKDIRRADDGHGHELLSAKRKVGALLEVDGTLRGWFSARIIAIDTQILSLSPSPSSADQQVLEALAALVALRHWARVWENGRITLAIRTDNWAALSMCAEMQPHGKRLGSVSLSCHRPNRITFKCYGFRFRWDLFLS